MRRETRSHLRAIALATAVAAGCAPVGAAPGPRAPAPATSDDAADDGAFAKDERRALDALAAADPRFAMRLAPDGAGSGGTASDAALRRAAVDALLAEDSDAMVHDGTLDFFSFAARARGLDAAAKIAASARASRSRAVARERPLLERLLEQERVRLADERDLPRGASELLRGMIETWAAPESLDATKARDDWAALRLEQLSTSLTAAPLPSIDLVELDDALDPLERLASPSEYPATAAAIARLRVALGMVRPAPTRAASWPRVERALRAHLGVALSPGELQTRLDRARSALRAAIAVEVRRPGRADDRAVLRAAEALVFTPARCAAPASTSAVRSLAPPPERSAICGALRSLAQADDGDALLATLAALDLEVTTATWSLAVHARGIDPERAEETTRPAFPLPPEREVRLLRLAAARPALALGAGLAAELLVRRSAAREAGEAGDLRVPARRWLAFGDAPLDVVEREAFAD